MDESVARANLNALIHARGGNYGALSRLLGRNPAYIQQYIKRGTPRKLDEDDRRTLARYFGVDESMLGGPARGSRLADSGDKRMTVERGQPGGRAVVIVDRLDLGASAGAGSLDDDERPAGIFGFDPDWLRRAGLSPAHLSVLRVDGDSMAHGLNDGDDIMVDRSDGAGRLRDGIYVLRFDDVLMVKRVSLSPRSRDAERGDARRWSLTISSDNPHYPSWHDVDPALVDIVGRVVWAGRRL